MFKKPRCPVIAIEEHYWDAELAKTYTGFEAGRPGPQQSRLYDLDDVRIKEMDEAGIDIQVLSHGAPSTQTGSTPKSVFTTRTRTVSPGAAAAASSPSRPLTVRRPS